jgi:hypothetical protein
MKDSMIQQWEEFAFYESGLSAHGCLEKLDTYTKEAIEKYGRCLLKQQSEYSKCFEENEKLKEIARNLYGVVLHMYEISKQNPVTVIGPNLFHEAGYAIKEYEKYIK